MTEADTDARLSPTLAAAFLGCQAAAGWTLEVQKGMRGAPKAIANPHGDLIKRKGMEHEDVCLAALRAQHGVPFTIERGGVEKRYADTFAAMNRGQPLIYQAALTHGSWLGYADFLVRVEEPCPGWKWSYEPWDAKLSREAKPEQVLQIALYGDFLVPIQGRSATRGHLMLGTGDPALPHRTESFELDEVRYYTRRAARRLEAFAAGLPHDLEPHPCAFCGKCDWGDACVDRWIAADHLHRVAGITKHQMGALWASGVSTLGLLAKLDGTQIKGIGAETLTRLVAQARLQSETYATGEGALEVLPHRPSLGFDRLPLPDPGDLFFDFEGDPMHPGGLEYLCGVLWRACEEDTEGGSRNDEENEAVLGHPALRFRAFWAHDREEEKQAFSELMAFLTKRLACSPAAHLYHYAPYEKTALRRLASMHAVAEIEVDDLLRSNRMIDLYRVVRESMRVGEESYSIKSLERFYMPARTTEVTNGGDSLVIYDAFRQTGETAMLDEIRDYNRDDCLSTLLLRDWLIEQAKKTGHWPPAAPEPDAAEPSGDSAGPKRLEREARERSQAELEAALTSDAKPAEADARQLLSDLIGFHRREAKPAWWSFFDRQEHSAEELQDDAECLGSLVADGDDWMGKEARSLTFRFRYPEQETKFGVGSDVFDATNGGARAGTVVAIDETSRTVTVKRGAAAGPLPKELSLIPGGPINTDVMRGATWRVAQDELDGGDAFPHITALLRRDPPRLAGWAEGAPIVANADRDDPARLLAAATKAVHALDRSWLIIQGPPGSGKTYTTSHLIASLIKAGKTVGVASNSHHAIDNVLHAVETRLAEAGEPLRQLGQKKVGAGEGFSGRGFITPVSDNKHIDPAMPIIGGTAWLFSRPELHASRDVLFIDEAGQVSLGNLIAMATAAKSIVLVGDQMQLAQPIQGAHPRESGVSALDHLLEGHAVVPETRGIFLSQTWRMHPDLCGFVSAAVYDGKLRSEAGCASQALVLSADAHPALKPTGLSFLPVAHEGRSQRSDEEAQVVKEMLESLLRQHVVDREGRQRRMALDDVLVVAPYNMQVNHLRSVLPTGARVGTVDKFQGQETEVVIVSMATSGADSMPRDAAFLLSRNRLNVAISRARCLAVLVASPGLLDLVAQSVEEMKLANLFCWAADYAAQSTRPPFRHAALTRSP
jgi:predicted RecB family nuclease